MKLNTKIDLIGDGAHVQDGVFAVYDQVDFRGSCECGDEPDTDSCRCLNTVGNKLGDETRDGWQCTNDGQRSTTQHDGRVSLEGDETRLLH